MRRLSRQHDPTRQSRPSVSESCREVTPHINGRRIFSSIHRFDSHQHAHLRCDLNHRSASRQARSRLPQSGGAVVFQWIRILLPPADSNSMMHPGSATGNGAMSSTNPGRRRLRGCPPSAASRSRFNFPPSRCSCCAVRFTPSRRATLTASDHNSSGIAVFRGRDFLQSSNRDRAPSIPLTSSMFVATSLLPNSDRSSRGGPAHASLPETHVAAREHRDLEITPSGISCRVNRSLALMSLTYALEL